MVRCRQLPKKLKQIKQDSLKRSPIMHRSARELATKGKEQLARHTAFLGEMEGFAKSMQAKHGHFLDIDTSIFDKLHKKIRAVSQRLDKTVDTFEKAETRLKKKEADARNAFTEKMKTHVPAEHLQKGGV